MRPVYQGVKFFGDNDLSIPSELRKAEQILSAYDDSIAYDDINTILEFYNIQKLIEVGIALSVWDAYVCDKYVQICKLLKRKIGRFFNSIDDNSFGINEEKVTVMYVDDFWSLFSKFKLYKTVSSTSIVNYLKSPDGSVKNLLKHKNIVNEYDELIANELRISNSTAEILISKYLKRGTMECFLPKSFQPSEFENIFMSYVHGDQANPNYLWLLYCSQSSDKCPISNKLRYEAKKEYDKALEKISMSKNTVSSVFGLRVEIKEQDEIAICLKHDNMRVFSYNENWLREHLDYPTVLNNFRYVFEMIDSAGRSTLVSVKSNMSAIESAFRVNGEGFYRYGHIFEFKNTLSNIQTILYTNFLSNHQIDLEDVFKWFFEEYLLSEFGVNGFFMNASSKGTNYIEKCRNLSSEMEGILKQFQMFVLDGKVDRDLLTNSSEQISFGTIPSLIDSNYAYPSSEDVKKELFLLFSDQSPFCHTDKTGSKYTNLYNMLNAEDMIECDFSEVQKRYINWLVQRGSVTLNKNGKITMVFDRVFILKDLYDNDVLCIKNDEHNPVVNEMLKNNDLVVKNTLFSEPEAEYLNFVLNKSKYSNGLDLRNMYAHSSYPLDEDSQYSHYIYLIKIMVLIVTKINEEFCYCFDAKNDVAAIR